MVVHKVHEIFVEELRAESTQGARFVSTEDVETLVVAREGCCVHAIEKMGAAQQKAIEFGRQAENT